MNKNKKCLNFKSVFFMLFAFFSFFIINNSSNISAASCGMFEKKVTITTSISNPSGGSIEAPSEICVGLLSSPTVTINLKTLNEGYKFFGWYDNNGNLVADGARSFEQKISRSGTYKYTAKVELVANVTYVVIGAGDVPLDYGTYEYIVGEEINLISFFEKQEGDITSYLLDGVEVAGSTYKVEDKDVTIQVPFLNSYVVTFVGDGGATPVSISQLVETGDIVDLPSSFNFDVYKYVFLNYKIDDVLYEADKYTVANKSVTIRAVTREKITSFYGSDFNTEIYETLEDALASGETKLYLGANYTVRETTTIPSNITLVLPYEANSTSETKNGTEETAGVRLSWSDPAKYLYLTLTVDEGVTLTIKGTLVVGGIQHYPHQRPAQGHTSGAYSQIINKGIINLEGTLRTYGLISGSGVLNANNGSKLYEPMMINDYAGGKNTQLLYKASGGHLPFAQIATANIQCKRVINYGATVYGYASLWALSMINTQTGTIIAACNNDTNCSNQAAIKMKTGSKLEMIYDDSKVIDTKLYSSDIHLGDFGVNKIHVYGEIVAGEFSMNASIYGEVSSVGKYFGFSYVYNFIVMDGGTIHIPESRFFKIMPGAIVEVRKGGTLNIDGGLLVYDALIQGNMSEKQYPPSNILEQYGFNKNGTLIVNGTININDGAVFAGVIQTTDTTNTATINTKNFNQGDSISITITDGGKGEYGDNTTIFTLTPRVYGLSGYINLERNTTYKAYSTDTFILESFAVTSANGCPGTHCESLEIELNLTLTGRILKWENNKYVADVSYYINSNTSGVTIGVGGNTFVSDVNGIVVVTYHFSKGETFYYYTVGKEKESAGHEISVGLYNGSILLDNIVEKTEFLEDEYTKISNESFGLSAKVYYYGNSNPITVSVKDPTLTEGYILYPNNAMSKVEYVSTDDTFIIDDVIKLTVVPAKYEEYLEEHVDLVNAQDIVSATTSLYSKYVSYRDACLNNDDKEFTIAYLPHEYASEFVGRSDVVVGEVTYGDTSKTITVKTLDGNNTKTVTVTTTGYMISNEEPYITVGFTFESSYLGKTYVYENLIPSSIKQKELSLKLNDIKTVVYGDEEQTLTMELVGEDSLPVNRDSIEDIIVLYRSDAQNSDAGTYSIYAESIHKGYKLNVLNEAVYVINPLPVEVSVEDHKNVLITNKTNDIEFTYTSELDLPINFEIKKNNEVVAKVINKKVSVINDELYAVGYDFEAYPVVDSANYEIIATPGKFDILNPEDYYTITISFTKDNKVVSGDLYYDSKTIEVVVDAKVNDDENAIVTYGKTINGSSTAIIKDAKKYEVIVSIGLYSVKSNVEINKKTITASANNLSFVYNMQVQYPTFTLNDVVGEDDVQIKTNEPQTINAKENYEIMLSLEGESASNYVLSTSLVTYSIAKKDVTLEVNKHNNIMESNKDYISDFTFVSSVDKTLLGNVTYVICNASDEEIAYVVNGEVTTLENKVYGVGEYKVYVLVDENNFNVTSSIAGDLEIVEDNSYYSVVVEFKKNLTLVNKTVEYDGFNIDVTVSVIISETSESVSDFTVTIKNSDGYTSIRNAGDYIVEVAIDDVVYSQAGTIKVTKKTLKTTVDCVSFVYNGQKQQPTFAISEYVEGDDVSVVTSTATSVNVGDNYSVSATLVGEDAVNYNLEFTTQIYEIEALSVELEVKPYRYLKLSEVGEDIFFEYTIKNNGSLNPTIVYEIRKGNDVVATVSNNQVSVEDGATYGVGEYKVYATIKSRNYYVEKSIPCDLVVVEDKDYYIVEVTFIKEDKVISESIYDGKEILVNVFVSLLETGESVEKFEYVINNSSDTKIINRGTYKVSVSVDNVTYNDYAQIVVAAREIDFVYDSTSFVYDGNFKQPTLSLVGCIEEDDIAVRAVNSTANVGDYTLNGTLVGTSISNYELVREITVDYSITKAKLEVTIDKVSSVFGNDENILTFTYKGNVSSKDNIYNFISLEKEDGSEAGYYDVIGTNSNSNYEVTFIGEEDAYEISKRPLTIDISKITITYGEAHQPLASRLIVGTLVGDDKYDDIVRIYRDEGNNAGVYTIYFENKSNNYDIQEITSTYTILPRRIEVAISDATSVYGDAYEDIKVDLISGTLASGETLDDVFEVYCPLERKVGIYEIVTKELGNVNYELTVRYSNDDYSIYEITKRPITIAADDVKVDSDTTWSQLEPLIRYEITSGDIAGNDDLNIELSIEMQSGITLTAQNYDTVFGGGTHTIKVKTSNSNYNMNIIYGKLVVTKCMVSIQGIVTSYVYDESLNVVPFNWRENIVNYNLSANDSSFDYVLMMIDSNGDYIEVETISEAGNYLLQINIIYTHAYEFEKGTQTAYEIFVDKKDISDELEIYNIPTNNTVKYNPLGFLPGAELSSNYQYVYYNETLLCNGEVVDMALNAGSYTYSVVIDNLNYKGSKTVSFEITKIDISENISINKNNNDVVVITELDSITADVEGYNVDVKFVYYKIEENNKVEVNQAIIAGKYVLKVVINAQNYCGYKTVELTLIPSVSGKIDELKDLTTRFEQTQAEEEKTLLIAQITELVNSFTQDDLAQIEGNASYQETISSWETIHESYLNKLSEIEKALEQKNRLLNYLIAGVVLVVIGIGTVICVLVIKKKSKKTLA